MSSKDLLVITPCSKPDLMLEEYSRQLAAAGIDHAVWPIVGEIPNGGYGGNQWQLQVMEEMLARYGDYEKIVTTDAWDVLFFGTKEETLAAIPDDRVLLAAESPYWPDEVPPGDTPWNAVNGGMLAGTPESWRKWIASFRGSWDYQHDKVTQFWLNKRLWDKQDWIHIDSHTTLFYCMHKDKGEIQFKDNKPYNTLCGTYPQFIHFQARCHTDPIPAKWLEQARKYHELPQAVSHQP